jgi:hypothetical protein
VAAAAGSRAAEREVAPRLLELCRSSPSDDESARALETLLAPDPRARAEAFLSVAAAAPAGPVRARRLGAAASAFAGAGDAIRQRETVRAAFEAWPEDGGTFRAALAAAEGDADATNAVLSLRASAVPGEAAACHRTRAALLLAVGRPGPAARAYEACLAVAPDDAGALEGLAEARAAEEDVASELGAARHSPGQKTVEPSVEASAPTPAPSGATIAELLRPLLASARALADAGELGAAYARLKLAREIDPDHLDLTLMLARVAEKLGHLEEALSLGEAWADAAAAADPASAAARFRELAGIARNRLSDAGRAASLLEKAISLEPDDPATASALAEIRASRRDEALQVLESQLAALRDHPGSPGPARAVAVISRELADGEATPRDRGARTERAAMADDLLRFGQRLGPAQRPLELAFGVGREVRSRVALPGADGATGRLLAMLSPYLEPLFPVHLASHGIAPGERAAPSTAPAVQAAFGEAFRALGGRQLTLLASRRPGLVAAVENTRPPSVVLGAEAAALPPGALAFLAARSVALASSGWALLGRFAPRDVLVLCELASRFAGGSPPPRGLPAGPGQAFLSALERSVPRGTRDLAEVLGPGAADELATLDPVAFTSALEGTAARLALLHAGDLHGALSVLMRLRRPGPAAPSDPAAALARPDLAALARFALSDAYLEERGMLLGWA